MTDITILNDYKRRKRKQEEIIAQALRIGLSLKVINRLMKTLREMAKDDYKDN